MLIWVNVTLTCEIIKSVSASHDLFLAPGMVSYDFLVVSPTDLNHSLLRFIRIRIKQGFVIIPFFLFFFEK